MDNTEEGEIFELPEERPARIVDLGQSLRCVHKSMPLVSFSFSVFNYRSNQNRTLTKSAFARTMSSVSRKTKSFP